MLDVIDLESRWRRYKIKSYIPHVIISLSAIVIVFISIFFLNIKDTKTSQVSQTTTTSPAIVAEKVEYPERNVDKNSTIAVSEEVANDIQTTVVEKIVQKKATKKATSSRTLTPSMNFIHEMQSSSQPYYENTNDENKITHNDSKNQQYNKSLTEDDIVENVIEEIVLENTIDNEPKNETIETQTVQKINIKRQNTHNDIAAVIKRFKKNNNPALSLFIAKKYYELGDYHNAYNYALITNEINREIEASWIIFAKSLVKLGKKEMAVKTLKEYVKQSHSHTGNILLDEIQSGQFK